MMSLKNQHPTKYGGMNPTGGFKLSSRNSHKSTLANRNGFRRNGSDNKRVFGLQPRTQSTQNSRPTYANKAAKFQERRFSKENYNQNSLNHNSFALLKSI